MGGPEGQSGGAEEKIQLYLFREFRKLKTDENLLTLRMLLLYPLYLRRKLKYSKSFILLN